MAQILIADDDTVVAEIASATLISAGHACGWVTSGRQALKLLSWRRPDLLLLEQDLPDMPGSDLLRELRGSSEFYDLPVIMFTALTGKADEDQARFNGAQDYIRKPFDPEQMVATVEHLLGMRSGRPSHLDLRTHLERSAGLYRDQRKGRSLA